MRKSISTVFYAFSGLFLAVVCLTGASASGVQTVSIGQTVNGALGAASAASGGLGLYDSYRLDLKAGQIVRILLVSKDLRLYCNVDFGGKTDIVSMGEGDLSDYGKIGKFSLGQLNAKADGSYTITVYSGRKDAHGTYTLTLTGVAFGGGKIDVGKKVSGTFTEKSATMEGHGVTDAYSLALKAHQAVTITASYGFPASGGQELQVVLEGKHYGGEFGASPQTKTVTVAAGDRDTTAEIDVGTGDDLGLPVNAGVSRPYTLSVAAAAKNAKISQAAEDVKDNGWGN